MIWQIFKNEHQCFDLSSMPPLDVSKGPCHIDISFLGNEDHTRAFVDSFEKMLRDSRLVLDGWTCTAVISDTPLVNGPDILVPPLTYQELLDAAQSAGRALYFSYDDSLALEFRRDYSAMQLYIRFDNPVFELRTLTA